MISCNRGLVNLAAWTAICMALWIVSSAPFAAAQSSWQAEWEKTLRAALPCMVAVTITTACWSIQEKNKHRSSLLLTVNDLQWRGRLKVTG